MNLPRNHKATPPGRGWEDHDIMSKEAVRFWAERKPRTPGRQGFEVLGAEEGL